jgi:hypothetical protein
LCAKGGREGRRLGGFIHSRSVGARIIESSLLTPQARTDSEERIRATELARFCKWEEVRATAIVRSSIGALSQTFTESGAFDDLRASSIILVDK